MQNPPSLGNHLWLPFTPNRDFRQSPRVLVGADGMHFTTQEGQRVLDGISSLWCVGAGHNRAPINKAIKKQLDTLDYATAFQFGNDRAFEAADMLAALAPGDLNRVFFCTSGSEAADTSLKMALAYHRACGQAQRTVFIGRERGYHGVGVGGISVGGIVANRKMFGQGIEADHLPHTQLASNAFSRGMPEKGAELADDGVVQDGRDVGEALLLAASDGVIERGEVLGTLLLALVTHLAAGHGFLRRGCAAEDVATGGLGGSHGLLDLTGGRIIQPGAELILVLRVIEELLELRARAIVGDLAEETLPQGPRLGVGRLQLFDRLLDVLDAELLAQGKLPTGDGVVAVEQDAQRVLSELGVGEAAEILRAFEFLDLGGHILDAVDVADGSAAVFLDNQGHP